MLSLAGDWLWLPGWIVGGWFIAVGASTMTWLARKDPALLEERFRVPGPGGQTRRDQMIIFLVTVGFVAWIILMPLDVSRFHWTPRLPLVVSLVGIACLALSWFFVFRAFADNPFGSALVRVQRERGHRVITSGVYGWVRPSCSWVARSSPARSPRWPSAWPWWRCWRCAAWTRRRCSPAS